MQPNTSVQLHLEPMSAILARVAYRLIVADFIAEPGAYVRPHMAIGDLARQLHNDGFRMLSVWVACYGFRLHQGHSTAATKQWIVQRSRWAALNREHGKPWARVPAR